MNYNNLSKLFRYINEDGEELIFDYAHGFLINKPAGIDTVSVSLSRAQGIGQVGETIQSKNIQARPVNVSGILVGDFQAENKDRLLSVIRPDIKGRLYADDYYLDVYPMSTPSVRPEPLFANFGFSLLAAYPYWQSGKKEREDISGLIYKFRLPCNFSKSYKFAEKIKNKFINVSNRGQMPIPFTAHILANVACRNPKILNTATGEFLLIEKEMQPGERITVEITHGRTNVLSSVDGDIRGALSLDSNLFRLDVGDNVLKPSADSGLEQLEISIEYAPEKVGITV